MAPPPVGRWAILGHLLRGVSCSAIETDSTSRPAPWFAAGDPQFDSHQCVVTRHGRVRRVEIHLRLRQTKKSSVAPTNLYVTYDLQLRSKNAVSHDRMPGDLRLSGGACGHTKFAELKGLVPVPGRCNTQSQLFRVCRAQYEVGDSTDSKKPPQHAQFQSARRQGVAPTPRGFRRDLVAQGRPIALDSRRQGPWAKSFFELPLIGGRQRGSRRGKRRKAGLGESLGVEALKLIRCCRVEPVGGGAFLANQQPFEQAGRAYVQQNPRQVLAADEIDVVNPQVSWNDIVTR